MDDGVGNDYGSRWLHALRKLRQPCGEAHVERNQGPSQYSLIQAGRPHLEMGPLAQLNHHSYVVEADCDCAPYFKGAAVVNREFKELSLDGFKGKYLVLFFYPLDFTFVGPMESIAFNDKANDFHDVDDEVVAISVDSHFSHLAWTNTPRKNGSLGHMNIALLSDLTKQISRVYGVLLEGPGLALSGLFIIDPNGVIKHLSVKDLPVGRNVEETLRLVKAFQFVEVHREVCPANWIPDSPTFKPHPTAFKEYFEKVNP
ncbi:LOW QUALITY PROTEIN: thioredoxin-dependent peroxide reductase, mitochondrial-like [Pteronotus mesoamericanus]|uniref:LOW QUALITY PROTEIN: thioredoxin-dependent peroxide reductase, mitochondrial-like n=1 Tax=Pteronotus mesoamericanus TaxID=1884717 RepID=UPI0023EDD7BE|nr:LOW QUALITY PROTEIN: thioredoxin-dependent peroxide reductase, mitochondrial-like [Pteronotus parnellii mesoamericanus]